MFFDLIFAPTTKSKPIKPLDLSVLGSHAWTFSRHTKQISQDSSTMFPGSSPSLPHPLSLSPSPSLLGKRREEMQETRLGTCSSEKITLTGPSLSRTRLITLTLFQLNLRTMIMPHEKHCKDALPSEMHQYLQQLV